MAANNIYLQVDFNSQTAQQNVNALNAGIAATGPTAEKSSKQATTALESVSVSVKQTSQAFGEMTAALAGLGIARLASNFVQVSSDLGRAQTMMAAFTGSAEEAAEVFEQIRAVAKEGIFHFKDLEETARQLLGFGMAAKDVPRTVKIITDQVAAMGGSIENVNAIVRIFGRVMDKDFVSAMDLMRLLPQQGIKVMEALEVAVGKAQKTGKATREEVITAMKLGVLDPMVALQTMLNAMQQQTGGAGAKINDAAKALKNLGDAFDEAKLKMAAVFGPALTQLIKDLEEMLAPLAGVIEELKKLPDPTKKLIVDVTAGVAAVVAFAGAWKLFTTVAGPAKDAIVALGGALAKSLLVVLTNPELLLAMGTITAFVVGFAELYPKEFQKLTGTAEKWVGDLWQKLQAKISALSKEGRSVIAAAMGVPADGQQDTGDIEVETKENLEKVQKLVQGWAGSAGRTLLGALGAPADAIASKYKELFDNLNDQIKTLHISAEHATQMRDQLTAAQRMETQAKLFEQEKKHIDEVAKYDEERVKGSYQAQIDYIEAMDAQDLRGKVAAIDKITELRIASAQEVAKIEDDQIQQTFAKQQAYLDTNRQALEAAGIDVNQAESDLRQQMTDRQKLIDQKAKDETQQYWLQGWKKANDAIIEDQKRIFESFKSVFDEIFDAITGKNPGKAMADVFKKLVLDQAKDMFSSSAAGLATAAAGYGYPEGGVTRGAGILSQLMQHGMAPRPPGAPPEQYNPARTTEVFKPLEDGANRFDDSTIRFAVAVDRLVGAGGGQPSQGYAERMDTTAFGNIFTQASQATGVPESLIRAVAQGESAMRPGAVSPKGAAGLMQLRPGTAQDMGVTDLFNPQQNVMGGAKYLSYLLDRYGGDVPSALAAYNMGPAAFDKAMASGGKLPDETRSYVKRITAMLPSAQGGADLGGAVFQAPPSGGIAAPDIGDLTAPSVTPTFQAPQYQLPAAWAIPQLSQSDIDKYSVGGGATPTTIERAKQAGAMGTILAGIVGGKGGGLGGGLTKQMSSMDFSKLGQLFGIGAAAPIGGAVGGTTVQSVLTSKAVGALATMGGMMLFSQGLQKRSALLTTMGGGLAGVGGVISNPTLMANLAAGPGGLAAGLGAGAAAGVGLGLFASGVQRGGGAGLGMDIGGGALAGAGIGFMAGGPLGAAIGAGIGAAAGLITGVVRLFVQTEQEKIRAQVKQVYGIDISNRQILSQIQQVVDQNYGGNVAVGIRSQEVQNLVRLYALSTGQAANMPRPMYNATIAQATGGLQLQPVYQGGVQVQNPYTGVTTYQYQTAVTAAQGLMPSPGSGLGVPGGAGLINYNFAQLNQQQIISTIQTNPAAITQASAAAATAGDSRLSTTQAMQEPLTLLT